MYLDFAPLEGITTALFRRLHHKHFPGVDRYYAPFLSPTQDHRFTPREQREIYPEYNQGLSVIPQLLTKKSEDFLWAAGELAAMGYDETNLNLGCPSGTVTAKGKGSGMLADLDTLRCFLTEIYSHSPCKVSIKTRLGLEDPEEFHRILELYQQFPVSELIIHPRIRKDFYRHPVRTAYFDAAYSAYHRPIGYNGSIITASDHEACIRRYPNLKSVMIGQGLVSDPFLAGRIKHGGNSDIGRLRIFHDELFFGYAEQFGNPNHAAKRMKELWVYLIHSFDHGEKYGKRILKSRSADEYLAAVAAVFSDLPILESSKGGW